MDLKKPENAFCSSDLPMFLLDDGFFHVGCMPSKISPIPPLAKIVNIVASK